MSPLPQCDSVLSAGAEAAQDQQIDEPSTAADTGASAATAAESAAAQVDVTAAGDVDWANLGLREAGRFVRTAAREAQEAAWQATNADARQIWGVREAQRLHKSRLRTAIDDLVLVRTLVSGVLQPGSLLSPFVCLDLLARIMDFEGADRGACTEFVAAWHRGPSPRPSAGLGGDRGERALHAAPASAPVASAPSAGAGTEGPSPALASGADRPPAAPAAPAPVRSAPGASGEAAAGEGGTGLDAEGLAATEGGLLVCVRKRPLLPYEVHHGEWDAVEAIPRDASVLCHDGRLSRSARQLSMTHRRFTVDKVWSAADSTDLVYADVAAPLLRRVFDGKGATLLCMGQTGTGKTHTMKGVMQCLVRDLAEAQREVEAEFLELRGRKCCDLFAGRKEVHLRSDAEGRVHVRGQRTLRLSAAMAGGEAAEAKGDSESLTQALSRALDSRASEKTERNEASSRSHAVCVLRLGNGGGVLRLVDLAGSERNFETTMMSANQHRESAEINSSLMVLKDCFRAHAALQRGESSLLPFRRSQLTRVLRDCFVDLSHATAVIATVSPAAADVIHTVNTLKHATMLAKPLADLISSCEVNIPLHLKGTGAFKDRPVQDWSAEDVRAWLQEAEGGRFAHVVVPPALDGRKLLCSSAQGLSDLFEGGLRRARVDEEGEAWNIQIDNVGLDLGREIFAAARLAATMKQ